MDKGIKVIAEIDEDASELRVDIEIMHPNYTSTVKGATIPLRTPLRLEALDQLGVWLIRYAECQRQGVLIGGESST